MSLSPRQKLAWKIHHHHGHPEGYDGPCYGPTLDEEAVAVKVLACPEPFWHESHRYCPACPWQEWMDAEVAALPKDGEAE